jgi:hypothetical protein
MNAIADALEIYYSERSFYPPDGVSAYGINSLSAGWITNLGPVQLLNQFPGNIAPIDPLNNASNFYELRINWVGGEGYFCASGNLENTAKENCTYPTTSRCPFVTSGATHYCVGSRQ